MHLAIIYDVFMRIIIFVFFCLTIHKAHCSYLKLGYVSGEHALHFGDSRTRGVGYFQVKGFDLAFEKRMGNYFALANLQMLQVDQKQQKLNENSTDLSFGRKFGAEQNYLAIMLGASMQQRVLGTSIDGVANFKSYRALSSLGGIRINSAFLSYDFNYHHYMNTKIEQSEMKGKMVSHRVALNLGKKFRYGLYYLSQRLELEGEHFNWRATDFVGAYLGWSFK
jgi:hypothetical protein